MSRAQPRRNTRKRAARISIASRLDNPGSLAASIRFRLHVSQEHFARLLDVSNRTVSRWEQPNGRPDTSSREILERLHGVVDLIGTSMEPPVLVRWLSTPKQELKDCTPIDLLRSHFGAISLTEFAQGSLRSN